MGLLDFLFPGRAKTRELLQAGAPVIDVRSRQEYKAGHVKGAQNIPLPELSKHLNKLKKNKQPLILCCASGARSGQAQRMLKREGIDCVNGGSWRSLA